MSRLKSPFIWLAPLVAVGFMVAIGYSFWGRKPDGSSKEIESDSQSENRGIVATTRDGVVHLMIPDKIASSTDIRWQRIDNTEWNEERVIPARLELDPGRHYAVTAPADVIVEELIAPLGSHIERGEPLVEMSSSQITTLRGGLARQQLLYDKAKQSVSWHKSIQSHVEAIVAQIYLVMDNLDSEWQTPNTDQSGEFGAKIVSAYAKYWATSQISKISQRASNAGVVAEKSIVERLTDRESAKANLKGAIEQARFEVQQAILAAESELAAAEGSLQSMQSDLRKYLGLKTWDNSIATTVPRPELPDRFVHRSPGNGTVLERYFANGERASMGELIILIADISKLWLVGELRIQDWDLLQLHSGDSVQAEIIGMDSLDRLPASIEMVGGIVQSNSGSVRLTASLLNPDQRLKPGMVARLIMSKSAQGIRIPATAIFSNDGVDYVVTRKPSNEVTLARVSIGSRKQDAVEILEGLHAGDDIMVTGVFPVASQAFLQKE